MIGLQVNGKPVQLDGPTPLLTYLEALEVNPRAVAVERNGAILEKGEYASTILGDGDVVEIVRMVGGGLAANGSGRGPACAGHSAGRAGTCRPPRRWRRLHKT